MNLTLARTLLIFAILAIAKSALIVREDDNGSDRALTLRKKYTLRLVAFYDNTFKKAFGANSLQHLNNIFKEVGKLYKKFGTSEVEVKVIKTVHINKDMSWSSHSGLETSSMALNTIIDDRSKYPDAEGYVMMVGPCKSTKGAGMMGACHPFDRHQKSVIFKTGSIEFGKTQKYPMGQVAVLAAHELGHLMGMKHDFVEDDWKKLQKDQRSRVAPNGKKCNLQKGVMSYWPYQTIKGFSDCSINDFATYMSKYPNCMKST